MPSRIAAVDHLRAKGSQRDEPAATLKVIGVTV
jgi:hypothetical protein